MSAVLIGNALKQKSQIKAINPVKNAVILWTLSSLNPIQIKLKQINNKNK